MKKNNMNEIFASATKIVLLVLIGALVAGLFTKIVDAKDFMSIVLMVVAFYFGQKTNVPVETPLP
jgi:uncharacterized membrane protein